MATSALEGGFKDPAIDAARAFRPVMESMARPGSIFPIKGGQAPAPCSGAAATVLLTLCDSETPVFLAGDYDNDEMRKWLAFHTGAPIVGASHCVFAVGDWDSLLPLDQYQRGTSEYPDRSATLIVETPALSNSGATLKGPGIKDTASFDLPELAALQANRAWFPLGIDFFFTAGDQVAALPRSTEVS